MKAVKLIVVALILIMNLQSCSVAVTSKDAQKCDIKSSMNIKKYQGCVLIGISPHYEGFDGSYATIGDYSFRCKDSIWTETYLASVMGSFSIGDSIK